MKYLWVLPLVVVIMAITACGDTTSPEPPAVSDSANATDLDVAATVTTQATSTTQPVVEPTPAPTRTPVPRATPTPAPSVDAKLHYNIALVNLSRDDFRNAIVNLDKAIELHPGFVDAYYERGLAYTDTDEHDRAIADFDRAIELDPEYADAYYRRGKVHYFENDDDRAITDFNKAIELDSYYAAYAYYYLARIHTFEGDYDAAIADFDRAIGLKPDYARAYYERGFAYHINDEYAAAIADYDKAIELSPDYGDAYYYRGNAYALKGDFDAAISDYGKAIELNPERADAYHLRGEAYHFKDDYNEAIADFTSAIELDSYYVADSYYRRGEAYHFKDDHDKAIADFTAVIELNSDNVANAYYFRGEAYYFNDEYDRAIADFTAALELYPDDAYAYYFRGNAHSFRNDYDEAVSDFEKVLEIAPDYGIEAEAAYAYLQRGIGYAREGYLDKAIADYDRAVEMSPDNPRVEYARKFIEPSLLPDELLDERIEWSLCKGILECGFVKVPADYRNPGAGSIRIAVNVRRADRQDERIGYLFVNPGGPGASGLELVQDSEWAFADELMARFDIIGFDPRGVGDSEPEFACGVPGERIALLATIDGDIDTPEEIAIGEAAANLCIESMGPVGGLLHSEYVARDMDEIRKALAAEKVSYLGYSYGSTLGVWYATLFPESVRAMVADGADNPVDKADTQQERMEEYLEESIPFEEQLEQALMACDSEDCPIYNDGDPVGYYYRAAEKLHLVNSAAGGVPYAAYLGVVSTLYDEGEWPLLWQGLHELQEDDDPTILLEFVMWQLDDDPTATNFTAHVNCLDGFVLKPGLDRATRLDDSVVFEGISEEKLPLQEAADFDSASACPFYDQFAPEPLDVPLDGGGVPILVIGNRSDPATPFAESEEFVTEVLSNGYLLETSHARHVVYPDNECVNDHVHRVLIDGVYPDERRIFCERED